MKIHLESAAFRHSSLTNDSVIVQSLRIVLQSVVDFVPDIEKQDKCDMNTAAIYMPLIAEFVSDPLRRVDGVDMAAGLAALHRLAAKHCCPYPIRSRSMLVEMVYQMAGVLLQGGRNSRYRNTDRGGRVPDQRSSTELLAA